MTNTHPPHAPSVPSAESGPGWVPVVMAADCAACDCCGEPVCPRCDEHYADCECPGPHQADEFEYREVRGRLEARGLPLPDGLLRPAL